LAWSPNGSQLLLLENISSAQMPLYLLDLPTGKTRYLTPVEEPINNLTAKWAKDGTVYLLTNRDQDLLGVATLEITTGEVSYLFSDPKWDVEALAVSPDGIRVAYTVNQDGYKRLFIHNQETGETNPVRDLPEGVVDEPVFSPDGESLVVSVQSPTDNLNIWVILETECGTKFTDSISNNTNPDFAI